MYKLNDEQVIISTLDFFPPMLDDPYTFGKIAAANAMSDVFAMGGQVLTALNIVCFPREADMALLEGILQGGAEKITEGGGVLAGGHSVYDPEIKYGLSVNGMAHPDKIYYNNRCQPGDLLILTKALGVGIVLSAMTADMVSDKAKQAAIHSMERLNRRAAEKMKKYQVHACTDVTGFGLIGHGSEMAGEGVTLIVDAGQLPVLPEVISYAEQHLYTGAGQRNRQHFGERVSLQGISPAMDEVLHDPQTSGGLLISVAEADAPALLEDIQQEDGAAAIIGQVVPRESHGLIVL